MLRTLWGDDQRYRQVYWSRFDGRFYFAGDGAKRDEEGYFWLLGRVDDVMLVAGHNISTMEVESALVDHPAVAEAAVIGIPDERWIEAVAAFVVLKGEATEADLIAHARARLAGFKTPKAVHVVDELPRNQSGKLLKRVLRDQVPS
jgi:acetyl-CoA synthetase